MQNESDPSKVRPVHGFKKSDGPRERQESSDARNKLVDADADRHTQFRC